MRQFVIVAIVVSVVANIAAAAIIKDVVVTFGGGKKARALLHDELDDSMTIKQLVEKTYKEWDMEVIDWSNVRMESHFGMTYKMEDTLAQAGIKDNTRIKLKAWSRLEDAAFAAVGGRIWAQDMINEVPEVLNGKKSDNWPQGLETF